MRTCSKCGSYIPEGKMLCQACGRPCVGVKAVTSVSRSELRRGSTMKTTSSSHRTSAAGQGFGSADMSQRIIFAAAYFGIFFFLPLAAFPNSEEAKFHANQGLVLFLFGLVLGAVATVSSAILGEVFDVLSVAHPLLMVYGAGSAFKGNCVELPVIGKLRILKDDRYL